MGKDVSPDSFNPRDRGRYRRKMQRCLDTLARMLADGSFSFPRKHIGLEVELNLVDAAMRPSMSNAAVLEALDDPSFTTELSQHNLELNVPPRPLDGDSALQLEDDLHAYLGMANAKAEETGAHLAVIGILPTLSNEHFDQKWLTNSARYSLLNDRILAARGEHTLLSLEGTGLPGQQPERLRTYAESILPEAACTSVQLHLQVAPEEFAAHWNAAQCLAGVQVALGANSPFLLGKALWQETRIPLFLQATDTRPEELKNQGVRPRVWFGERWITSIFDLFEENVRYFPGLLPETDEEEPMEALESGLAPKLSELRLHNGTVWRWNRPVYDVVDGKPHLRVENRVLPAGPTVLDMMANAAFFYGAQRALAEQERPVWTQMSFQAAEENLYAGARNGFDAQLYWPGNGWLPPDELALRVLLPLAREGLRNSDVSDAAADRYLGVIERRCVTKRTGAAWQRETVANAQARGMDRDTALATMLARYLELAKAGEPVHAWPVT
ncbi:glutamate--cysteine ligase [Prauserella sp. PE36]|uniref:glutamate-cysteine ligase family protein n=1 Tax=Prauserella sp. PE36 TaxID=1504709 RepID=UPI000D960471|nr:glutamate-cysteine ligase family protein [Prauserella sp. PE36]PXY37060.1 glutamate--cysteine ligase [Prauserella coralliicola]RBM10272.1 glutamate--cysteine ligase [Prauserella sp. PE36]